MMTKVVFFHGLWGNPKGTKYKTLCEAFGAGNVYSEPLGFQRGPRGMDGRTFFRMTMVFGARLRPAVGAAQRIIRQNNPDVIVASSLGAAIAIMARHDDTPMVLLAPAWNRESVAQVVGYKLPGLIGKLGQAATGEWLPEIGPRVPQRTVVLHSELDTVIPFADSEKLVQYNHLGAESLVQVGYSHDLNEPEALDAMVDAVRRLGNAEMRMRSNTCEFWQGKRIVGA